MARYVLKRPFLGPDGRLYRRMNAKGELLVHEFPKDWSVPKSAVPAEVELAAAAAKKKLEPDAPEPKTLRELQKAEAAKVAKG